MDWNIPIIIVFLVLMLIITALWGLVNYMKGREQAMLLMMKTIGVSAEKLNELTKQTKDQKAEK